MDVKEFSEAVKRTLADLESPTMNQLHTVLGMVCEAGELADIFKANIAYKRPVDWDHVSEEVGDLFYFTLAFCIQNNLDFGKILEANFQKLSTRYPEGFSEKNANKRNLKKEKKALVSVVSSNGKPLSKKAEKRILKELGYKTDV